MDLKVILVSWLEVPSLVIRKRHQQLEKDGELMYHM